MALNLPKRACPSLVHSLSNDSLKTTEKSKKPNPQNRGCAIPENLDIAVDLNRKGL